MKKYSITYRMGKNAHEVEVEGFEKAQDQVAMVMNAGGEILGVKEKKTMKYELTLMENGKFTDHSYEGDAKGLEQEIERLEKNGGIVVKFTDEEGREFFKMVMGRAVEI